MIVRQFEPIFDEEDIRAVSEVIRSGYINEHKLTREFERRFAEFVGAKYAVATTSGTISIFLALRALGIGLGDKVIVPSYTAIGTASSVRLSGASHVLVDVSLVDGNVDPMELQSLGKDPTIKAVLPVHVNGRAARIREVSEIASKFGWAVIEDASQSLGSLHEGKQLGSFGEVGCFSMATTKIITTGQGGVVVTDRRDLYENLMALKDQGRHDRIEAGREELSDYYPKEGYNFKFTEIQAALGLSQFKKLEIRIKHKRKITELFYNLLKETDPEITCPPVKDRELLWYPDVLLPRKGQNEILKEGLKKEGIGVRLFHTPLHLQPPFRSNRSLPKAEEFSRKGISLPSSSNLDDGTIRVVCEKFHDCLARLFPP